MNLCVTVSDYNISNAIEQLSRFDYGEIRLDLTGYGDEYLKEIFSQDKILIATLRPNGIDDAHRIDILMKAIDYGASYVDIELEMSTDLIHKIVSYAREKDCKVIISYHNYLNTDSYKVLESKASQCYALGADIAKIVTFINHPSDLKAIYKLSAEFDNIITIGMGDKGKITRLNSIFNGAPFTYVYQHNIRNKIAEGQMKYQQVKNIMKLMDY